MSASVNLVCMNIDDVEKLILLMQRYELTELQVHHGELQFVAKKGEKQPLIVAPPVQHIAPLPAAPQPAAPVAEAGKPLKEIPSPIVGTFYRSPSPDAPHYKEVGDHVNAEDVVCIVEAMKVMNEIKAGITGTIKKVLVEDSTAVEYGQPLFMIE